MKPLWYATAILCAGCSLLVLAGCKGKKKKSGCELWLERARTCLDSSIHISHCKAGRKKHHYQSRITCARKHRDCQTYRACERRADIAATWEHLRKTWTARLGKASQTGNFAPLYHYCRPFPLTLHYLGGTRSLGEVQKRPPDIEMLCVSLRKERFKARAEEVAKWLANPTGKGAIRPNCEHLRADAKVAGSRALKEAKSLCADIERMHWILRLRQGMTEVDLPLVKKYGKKLHVLTARCHAGLVARVLGARHPNLQRLVARHLRQCYREIAPTVLSSWIRLRKCHIHGKEVVTSARKLGIKEPRLTPLIQKFQKLCKPKIRR